MKNKTKIDDTCIHCKKGLAYLKELQKRNKNAYGRYILHPVSRLIKENRDLGEKDKIKGLTIIPDYNSQGYLTHFHIEKEKTKDVKQEVEKIK